MINLKLESWSAMAPAMETIDSWKKWFEDGLFDQDAEQNLKLKQVPPLLRRRFSTLGKYAAHAVFNLNDDKTSLPTIYASRHGDTALTLSLLENIGLEEPMSPTDFSLAVHNAVGGLLSIAQKETAPMTAIASMDNLVLSCLQEAAAQLQSFDKVLCVIYDAPLPELYSNYADSLPFPVALAFVVSATDSAQADLSIGLYPQSGDEAISKQHDLLQMIEILVGGKKSMCIPVGKSVWQIAGVAES